MKKLLLFQLVALLVLVLAGWIVVSKMRAIRPPAPPAGSPITYPWGAMHLDVDQDEPDSDLEQSIATSIRSEAAGGFDPDQDGRREYSVLILSGGDRPGHSAPVSWRVGPRQEHGRTSRLSPG